MQHLVASRAERHLDLSGHGTCRVPAPKTGDALAVLAYYQREARGEATSADWRLLRSTCAGWLPLRGYSVLFADRYPEAERRATLMSLIWAGIPPRVREQFENKGKPEKGEEIPTESPPEDWWSRQMARYCARTGSSHEEAMAVPWPAMLGQLSHLPMLRAQAQKDVADANILVRSEEGEEAYEDLAEQARGGSLEPEETPDTGAWSDDPEERKKWEARKMAELKEVKQNMKKRTPRDLNQ